MTITQGQYEILQGLKNGLNLVQISENTNTPYGTIKSRTATLANRGLVRSRGRRRTPVVSSNVDLRSLRHQVR